MDIAKIHAVSEFASRWAHLVAERHDLMAFAAEKTWLAPGRASTNVPLGVPDHASDEDAPVLIDRAIAAIKTDTPSAIDSDGLRILRVKAAAADVGGRPGLIAHLDIQYR